jgi:hypothetical protein
MPCVTTPRPAEPATHAELAEALATMQLGMSASELHGALAGYLAAGGMSPAREWLSALALEEIDDALGDAPARELFDRLFSGCAADLEDPELAFDLLLPDDTEPMGERAIALVDWCRGFLGGLGLAGADLEQGLTSEASEILGDLARIAATRFDEESGGEDDEVAYAEVVEYVRVGVLVLHQELARSPDDATRH